MDLEFHIGVELEFDEHAIARDGALVQRRRLGYRRAFIRLRVIYGRGPPDEPVGVALQGFVMAKSAADKAKGTEHPDYHFIKVVMTDGSDYMTRSTYGKEGDTLNLDIDPNTHPAWTGGEQKMLDRGGRVSRFNSRFGALSFGKK